MFGGLGLGPFKKEKPFQTFQGYGGGAGGAGMAGAGQSPITATGGTKMTDGDYTFHVWGSNAPASQAFSVSSITISIKSEISPLLKFVVLDFKYFFNK